MTDSRAWLDTHPETLTVALSSKTSTVRITSAGGATITAVGVDASRNLFASLEGRKVWAADAALQEREHRAFLTELGWPRIHCAQTVDRALLPEKHKTLLLPGQHVAELIQAHRGADPALRIIALGVEHEDRLWRKVARRGYIVDTVKLAEERSIRSRELATFTRRSGIDIRKSDSSKAGFLDAIGAKYTETKEYGWSWPGQCDASGIPAEFAEVWAAYTKQHSTLKRTQILRSLAQGISGDGRLHPLIRTNQATTGRMAVSSPAVGGVPRELRGIILAEPGTDVIEVDHSSAEMRVLARLMGDPTFTQRILTSDPYAQLGEVTGFERNYVKPWLLAFVYDQTLGGLAAKVGAENAQIIQTAIRRTFPEIVAWRDEQTAKAKELPAGARLTTLWGRPLPVLDGRTHETRYGLAANAQVQGSARDAFGLAVVRADAAGLDLFIPLHDAIYILAPTQHAKAAERALVEAMTIDLGEGVVLTGTPKNHGSRWGY